MSNFNENSRSNNIQAKKRFGQNFIKDPKLIKRIVDLIPSSPIPGLVIEIGPGKGALTSELIKRFPHVLAIEIDRDLVKYLQSKFDAPNFNLVEADVLEVDLEKLIRPYVKTGEPVYVVANLPYYITSPVLFKIFANSNLFTGAIFMMQEEVARRLTANKNENNFNNLSVAASFYADKKYEFLVKSHYFQPQPKVDSAMISLTMTDKWLKTIKDSDKFISFIRQLFNNRRKTILNNLGNYLNDKNRALTILNEASVDPQLRPENLGLEEYLTIFKLLIS